MAREMTSLSDEVDAGGPPGEVTSRAPRRVRAASIGPLVRSHWPFLALLAAGAVIRAIVAYGIRAILWYIGDSVSYLSYAVGGPSFPWRPNGYSLMLRVLEPLHRLAVVAVVQHIMGLAIAVLVYAVCLRLGLRQWVASLAAVPVLFDAWQITTEQYLLSEALFTLLVGVALALVLWSPPDRKPPIWMIAAGGFLLGAAADTRSIGVFLAVPIVVVLLVRRVGIRKILVGLVLFAVPVVGYATWFDTQFGWLGLSPSGVFLYGRVSGFADCAGVSLTADQRMLCPTAAERRLGPDYFMWDPRSPLNRLSGSLHHKSTVAEAFSVRMIEHRPGSYVRAVWGSLQHEYSPYRSTSVYNVRRVYPPLPDLATSFAVSYQHAGDGQTRPSPGIERFLAGYQRHVFLPGLVFLIGLLVAAAGVVVGRDPRRMGLRSATFAFGASGLVLLVVPLLTAFFDYRYLVPVLPLLSVATATGGTLVVRRVRRVRPLRGGDHFVRPLQGPAAV